MTVNCYYWTHKPCVTLDPVLFPLYQGFPTFMTPWTSFMEDNFSMDWGGGGLGMIQAHTFVVHFIPLIITSAPPQIIRH